MKNIDADTVESYRDLMRGLHEFKWFKNGKIVFTAVITDEENLSKKLCIACFKWRGQKIELKQEIYKEECFLRCPECRGIMEGPVECSCGELPHRIYCKMGIKNYFFAMEKGGIISRI